MMRASSSIKSSSISMSKRKDGGVTEKRSPSTLDGQAQSEQNRLDSFRINRNAKYFRGTRQCLAAPDAEPASARGRPPQRRVRAAHRKCRRSVAWRARLRGVAVRNRRLARSDTRHRTRSPARVPCPQSPPAQRKRFRETDRWSFRQYPMLATHDAGHRQSACASSAISAVFALGVTVCSLSSRSCSPAFG